MDSICLVFQICSPLAGFYLVFTFVVLTIEPRALHLLGKFSAAELYSQRKVSVAFSHKTANHPLKPWDLLSETVPKKPANEAGD